MIITIIRLLCLRIELDIPRLYAVVFYLNIHVHKYFREFPQETKKT